MDRSKRMTKGLIFCLLVLVVLFVGFSESVPVHIPVTFNMRHRIYLQLRGIYMGVPHQRAHRKAAPERWVDLLLCDDEQDARGKTWTRPRYPLRMTICTWSPSRTGHTIQGFKHLFPNGIELVYINGAIIYTSYYLMISEMM